MSAQFIDPFSDVGQSHAAFPDGVAHAVIAQDELIEAGLLQDLEQRMVDIRMHFHVVDALGDDRQQLGDRMRRQRIAELILQGDGQIGVLIEQPVQFHLKIDRCIIV